MSGSRYNIWDQMIRWQEHSSQRLCIKEGKPEVSYTNRFSYVSDGNWYTDAIMWQDGRVATGYSNGNFGPGDKINREQMAVMMYHMQMVRDMM